MRQESFILIIYLFIRMDLFFHQKYVQYVLHVIE